jgi:multiple sugar transport system substrate-binding protein
MVKNRLIWAGKARRLAVWISIGAAALALSACAQVINPVLTLVAPTPAAENTSQPDQTGTPAEQTATPTFEPLPTVTGPQTLTVWVPPQFDPSSGTAAANLLQARLDQFMSENKGVVVETRVKAASGPGSLLEALTAASAAAPEALPSIVALSRSDLESAALKGLIYPLGGLSTEIEDGDWYAYARDLSAVDTSVFGLPFAGNALLMVYRPQATGNQTPATWDEVLAFGQPVIFQVDDAQSLLTLDLYLSQGSTAVNDQGRPALELDALTQTLGLFEYGAQRGSFPAWITQYQTAGQAWQAYQEKQADWVVTWSLNYLSAPQEDTLALMVPSMGEKPYALTTGWSWALSDPDPVRRELSLKLAEYLVQSDFLAAWNPAAGYLPTRPTVLSGWEDQATQSLINQIVLSAQIRPANEILAGVGPILRDASLAVIKGQSDAAAAAQSAIDRLGTP